MPDGARRSYLRAGGRSVQLPWATSAAMPMLSPSVGCGWMVLPMSTSSAPISMAKRHLADHVAGMGTDDAAAEHAVRLGVEQQLGEALVAAIGDGPAGGVHGNRPFFSLMPLALASSSVRPTHATSGSV